MRAVTPAAVVLTAILALAAGAAAAPSAADRERYAHWCARCHGADGDGRGPAAAALAFNLHPPRDFTRGRFKLTSVPAGAPTDADLARTIARGLPGTSMPYFSDLLSPAEIAGLVEVVRAFGPPDRTAGTPVDLGPEPAADAASRARGALRFVDLGCPACHGAAGRGDGPAAAQLRTEDGVRAVPADLTRPWTFRGGGSARDVAMRLAAGIGGTAMPSYLEVASIAELWDVAHFVGSLARAPSLERAAVLAAREPPGAGEPLAARGEYVAKSGTCFLCHVQMNPDGSYVAGSFGAGGMPVVITDTATVFSRNLTPDPTGLAGWTAADLRRALRDGRGAGGRALDALDMPWTITAGLADRDIDALHAYLATLPPVANLVPAPRAPGLGAGVAGKLGALLAGTQIEGAFHPGNAGRPPPPGEPILPVSNPRADLWVALGALAFVVLHRGLRRGCGRAEAALVSIAALGVPLVYGWPPFRWMPPALVRAAPPFARVGGWLALPPLRPPPEVAAADADTDTRALVARGRYVATIGTCPLCHTGGPSPTRPWAAFPEMGGGVRVRWRVFGTTWSRNLTPDDETGLGGWTAAEIRRAITSGIARDGRLMHWQAMPWDHFSNLSPEDLEALIAYLRHLPAAWSRVPAPEPPGPDDPDGDTFAFGYSGEYRP
jgi:mono/diheme cytochrome c family protein